ncbi:PAS domain S-box protein [Thermodesulfobacteriota bacterium]
MIIRKFMNYKNITDQFLLIGIGIGILFWILESFVHVFVFGEGSFASQALNPDLHELWMRILIILPCILFGLYAQFISRKRKKALRESEEQLKSIYMAADEVSIIITDEKEPDPKITEFSPGAENIFGYTRSEIIGKPVSVLHLPEEKAKLKDTHKIMRGGEKRIPR